MQRPPARELEVAVDEPRGVECTGLYSIEYVNGELLRWTGEAAEIKVPIDREAPPRTIRLGLWPLGPPGGTQVTVNCATVLSAHVDGKPILCEQPLSGLDGASVLVIRLESPGFQFHADRRRLGVALAGLTLQF